MATVNETTSAALERVDRANGEVTLAELLAGLPPEQVAAIDHHYQEIRAEVLASSRGGATSECQDSSPSTGSDDSPSRLAEG